MSDYPKRRRFPRIPTRNTVLVKRLADDVEGFAHTRTMSLGGCGFLSKRPMGEGAHLELLISVDRQVARAEGWVVYERPAENGGYEIGVAFTELADEDRQRIESLFPESPAPDDGGPESG